MFNVFRYAGDLLHLASFFILLLKMYSTRSVKGVSLKTQVRLKHTTPSTNSFILRYLAYIFIPRHFFLLAHR